MYAFRWIEWNEEKVARLFFPTLDPLAGTLSAYATFAIGFVARPLGGAFFGHFGDRRGRKSVLVWLTEPVW